MYVVQCPKCQHRMKTKEALHQVKVRCAHCKEVFLAETQEIADAPAPARPTTPAGGAPPARPAAPRPAVEDFMPPTEAPAQEPEGIDLGAPSAPSPTPGAPRPMVRKRKKSIVPMIVVIGGGVLCLVGLIVFIWTATHKRWKDPLTGEISWKSSQEVDALLAAKNKPPEQPANAPSNAAANTAIASVDNVAPPDRPVRPRPTTTTTNPTEGPWVPPPGETADDITEENAKGMDEGAVMADKDKDKVLVRKNKVYPDEQEPRTGDVAIEVENLSPTKTIRTLVIRFEIMNQEHVVGETTAATLEYIPPSTALKYSVKYRLSSVGKNFRAVVAKLEYAPDDVVCWILRENLQFDESVNDILKITGHARNANDRTVRDIVLYYTLLNPRGELVDPKEPLRQVKLQDKTSLIKDASDRFIIRFDKRSNTEIVKDADIRVVGKKG